MQTIIDIKKYNKNSQNYKFTKNFNKFDFLISMLKIKQNFTWKIKQMLKKRIFENNFCHVSIRLNR